MANDWNSVRDMALDCLNSTWTMVRWAARSQEDDYDTEKAALHLAAIDTALNTFRQAMEIFQPGFECATSDLRYSPVFDALALASVGEGPRPDFGICATAHEKAFELLRLMILWIEDGLNDELDSRGAPDNCLEGIDDLHKRSPVKLRDDLQRLVGKNNSLQSALSAQQLRKLSAWVTREWAAVASQQTKEQATAPVVVVDDPVADVPRYSIDRVNRTLEWFGERFESIERNPFQVIEILYDAFENGSPWVPLERLRDLCKDVRALDKGMAELFTIRVKQPQRKKTQNDKKRVKLPDGKTVIKGTGRTGTKHAVYEFIEKRGGVGAASYRLRPKDEIPV